ncbi:MAG: hypothetical protein JNL74_12105 [Fibrobacteres bacterium]|nr:hypothetical protein [Fibrobacterota bacterium]
MTKSDKERIVLALNSALQAEEKAIPIYLKHMTSIIQFSGLSTNKISRIKEIFGVLKVESERHVSMLNKIKSSIEMEAISDVS